MGGRLTTNEPGRSSEMSEVTYDPDVIRKLLSEASLSPTKSEKQPCDCEYCREFARYARPRNISPLAAIDVYSLPEDTGAGVPSS